jgi:putative oxidoreductase
MGEDNFMAFLARWQPQLLSAFRLVTALVFMQHGMQKLFHFPMVAGGDAGRELAIFSLLWFAGIIELFGGALIAVGLWTRIVAFLASGEMAIAYFTVHLPMGLYPILNRGDEAVLFCFAFLYLAAAGGGAWGLDALLAKSPKTAHAR